MSEIAGRLISFFQKGRRRRGEEFVGSGFIARIDGQSVLVTAGHVASSLRPPFVGRSHDGAVEINSPIFVRSGFKDIAVHALPLDIPGLEVGTADELVRSAYALRIQNESPFALRPVSNLRLTHIDSLTVDQYQIARGSFKPRLARVNLTYVSPDGSPPACPGYSGLPVLNRRNQVFGVHVSGHTEKPYPAQAEIFVKDIFPCSGR